MTSSSTGMTTLTDDGGRRGSSGRGWFVGRTLMVLRRIGRDATERWVDPLRPAAWSTETLAQRRAVGAGRLVAAGATVPRRASAVPLLSMVRSRAVVVVTLTA